MIITFSKNKNTKTDKKEMLLSKKEEPKQKSESKEKEEYIVDIKGEINNPGIYTLKKDSRIIDVINQAGGLTENANTTVINLSKKITDEMVIIIYSNYEIRKFKETKELEIYLNEQCKKPDSNSLTNDACIDSDNSDKNTSSTSKISLNNATVEELMTLSGVGEAKANDIISYRNSNGGFKTIDELKNVKGIGDSIFDKIKDRLTL